MVDVQTLFSMVDALPPQELEQLYQHIRQRRQVLVLHTAVTSLNPAPQASSHEPAESIRAEVDALIDEAIDSAKRKRETRELAKQVPEKS